MGVGEGRGGAGKGAGERGEGDAIEKPKHSETGNKKVKSTQNRLWERGAEEIN